MDRSTVGQDSTEFQDDSTNGVVISSSKVDAILNALVAAITAGEGAYAVAAGTGIADWINAIVAGQITTVTATSDWDNYKISGFFVGDGLSNACSGSGTLRYTYIIPKDATNCVQYQRAGASGAVTYTRDLISGVWSSWATKEHTQNSDTGTSVSTFEINSGGSKGTLDPSANSANRVYTLPDKAGTVAMTSDVFPSVLSKTTTYTMLATDNGKLLEADTSGGAWTYTLLPAATVGSGGEVTVKMSTTSLNKLTIDANGSETIGVDGDLTLTLGIPGQVVKLVCDGSNWQIVYLYPLNKVLIYDEKANGTAAGTSSSGVNTRVLNTEKADTGNNAALSSNQITLSAGTYRVTEVSAPVIRSGAHKIYLYNTTGTADVLLGTSEYNSTADNVVTRSFLHPGDKFTIAVSQALEVRHYIANGATTDGLGLATSSGQVERYAVFSVERIQ